LEDELDQYKLKEMKEIDHKIKSTHLVSDVMLDEDLFPPPTTKKSKST